MVTSYRVTSVWGQRIEALLQGRFCRKGKEDEALCVLYFLHKGGDVSQWYSWEEGEWAVVNYSSSWLSHVLDQVFP